MWQGEVITDYYRFVKLKSKEISFLGNIKQHKSINEKLKIAPGTCYTAWYGGKKLEGRESVWQWGKEGGKI